MLYNIGYLRLGGPNRLTGGPRRVTGGAMAPPVCMLKNVICWLPVNKQYHDEVCIMQYNQLKGVETSLVFFKTQLLVSVVNALVLVR
jgi:hypothetical protein